MNDAAFYLPREIPGRIRSYDSMPRQLAANRAGKNGHLRVVFRNTGNRTVIAEQLSEAPFHAQRALYCEESLSGMAYFYMVSSSGGILQGDRHRIDVTAERDSVVHMTTQGATRIYGMDAGSATQVLNITLEDNAYLEFIPDQIIPYGSSRFYQEANLCVNNDATLFYSEIITPGRVAMGESFAYDVCHMRTRATDQGGALLFTDAASMEPARRNSSSFGILGKYTITGSVYILGRNVPELHQKINARITSDNKVSGGASMMRNNAGLLVRILGCETEQVRGIIFGIAGMVRKECTGASFSPVRKS